MSVVVGIALGRNTHQLVYKNEDGGWTRDPVPNSSAALEKIFDLEPTCLVFAGNRQWGLPLAYSIRSQRNGEVDIRYLPKPTEKGKKINFAKFLQISMEKDFLGRNFFMEKRPEQEPEHDWYKMAKEYIEITEEVRRAKHLVLSTMAVLFPEAVRPSSSEIKREKVIPQPTPSDLWTKKMGVVLKNPNPIGLENDLSVPGVVRILAKSSLGRNLPQEIRDHHANLHRDYLDNLRDWKVRKEKAMGRLKELVGDHPIVQNFPKSDSAVVLTALLGWRSWPSWRSNHLQSFCGLALTRLDSKGNRRTSRKRPEITNYLYLLATCTDKGKELSGEGPLVRRLERLLKNIWRMGLK